jgi:chromosome segregation ATPase
MSSDNIQRQIEFILEHQAKFSEDIGELRAAIGELKDVQKRQGETVDQIISEMESDRRETRDVLHSVLSEMREGFNNLIVANEATRDLANKVASLEVQTSQRATALEQRVTDLESNP